jgi:ribose 5-phosphate isomerase B
MKSFETKASERAGALACSGEVIVDGGRAKYPASTLVGIAADHGGFELKQYLLERLRAAGCRVSDFGNRVVDPTDDYPDFVIPLARAVARAEISRGVAICGSGVGVCIAANKVLGVRAGVLHDAFSAHRGVEDDDLNVICLGGLVVGHALAWDLVQTFLTARFSGSRRHRRRLAKIAELEAGTARDSAWPNALMALEQDESGDD